MRRRIALLTMLVTLVLWLGFGAAGFGQADEPADTPAAEAPAEPTAEQVMQQLLERRRQGPPLIEPSRQPAVEPVLPERPRGQPELTIPLSPPSLDAAVVGPGPDQPRPMLLREGQFLVQRLARIVVTADGTHIAVFDQDPADPQAAATGDASASLAPMILLRSRRLEAIEDVLARHGQDTVFRLTGPVYRYHDANYLLPTQASPVGRAETPAPATPQADAAPDAPDTEAQRITRQLIEQLTQRSLALPAAEGQPGSSTTDPRVRGTAPGSQATPVELLHEGELIVTRHGRLVRTAEGFQLFVFEADDRQSPEAPLLLQPSGLLERMERIVAERGDSVVFVLSGQVQTYRGANYLLPTMMKVAFARGNLEIDS